jgi:hypothetical protein
MPSKIPSFFRDRLRVAAVALVLTLVAGAGLAQTQIERQGYFEVRSARTSVVDGVHELDARLQLVLSTEALDALNNGVPLTIELQIQVIRVRRFYLDAVEAELFVDFELEYRPLSQRYIVRNLNSGEQESFATLFSALNELGRITDLPVVDEALLEDDVPYRIRVRAMLQTQQYPAPLRLLFFWRSEWHLQSEWYEWMLER